MWPIFLSFGGEDVADYAFRTLEDRQKIEKLWEDGRTPKEISETTGVSVHVLCFPCLYRQGGLAVHHAFQIVVRRREQDLLGLGQRLFPLVLEINVGLVYCADCGAKLYHCRTASWTHEQECYTCANYRNRKQCSAHYIRAVVLERLVLQNLQRVVAYAQEDEDEFVRRVMENKTAVQRAEQEQAKRTLEKQERRINELDAIIQRIYEDHVMGKLNAERFAKLSEGYEKEQADLKQSVENLRAIVNAAETQAVNVQSFLKIVKKYTEPTELTPAILREFVEKVVVHAPDKSSGHRVQRIDVHYTFIGEIDLSPEYSKYEKETTA